MPIAPQQNWPYYDAQSRAAIANWLRSLTLHERLAIYEDMFTVYWEARRNMPGDWEKLDQWRWKEKVAMRRRMVEAFRNMDEHERGPTTAKNVG